MTLPNKIITNIIGGLGNQFFQYATGRAISYKTGLPLVLDISEFENYQLRNFLLNEYNIHAEIISRDTALSFKGENRWQRYLNRFIRKRFIVEKEFAFDSSILDISKPVFLYGYWQSEKYFVEIRDILLKELTLKSPLSGLNLDMATHIQTSQSVALHVRRGDYISGKKNTEKYAICSLDYYKQSIQYFAHSTKNPYFFIFSDDHAWVKENLRIDYPTVFVDHNPPSSACEDLRLMSLCQHQIIANSSFSWWAAWLNPNPNKIVIAPQKWFNDLSINTSDLIPDQWIRL